MKKVDAIRKAKSLFGREGMALDFDSVKLVGEYRYPQVGLWASFFTLGEGPTWEAAFNNVPTQEGK